MAQETRTYFDADGTLISQETVEVPDPPTALIDLPTLAAQVTSLSAAVDDLIVQSLGAPA